MPPSTFTRRLPVAVASILALCCGVLAGPAATAAKPDKGKPGGATATTDYVALGDSYSSGNGTFAANLSWGCYRSTYAYPYLVAQQRADTDLTFVACQGATTEDVVGSQVRSLDAGTDVVTLTIGGNDIGFSDLIFGCAGDNSSGCDAAVAEANRKIDNELPAKLDAAYAAIRSGAPNAQVIVLGYGRFFGNDLSCAAADGVTAGEAAALNGVADNLDATIAAEAAEDGFAYQSGIVPFTGHDVCARTPYLNGHSWSIADMWHPSRAGHADGMAPLVRAVIG